MIDARTIADDAIGLFIADLFQRGGSIITGSHGSKLIERERVPPAQEVIDLAKASAVAEVVAGVEAAAESRTIRVCIYGDEDAVLADRIFGSVAEVEHAERIGLFSTRLREVS